MASHISRAEVLSLMRCKLLPLPGDQLVGVEARPDASTMNGIDAGRRDITSCCIPDSKEYNSAITAFREFGAPRELSLI
jgi:hypothetical protein